MQTDLFFLSFRTGPLPSVPEYDGIQLIKAGKEIDYVGATALELVGSGESSGSFAEILIDNQKTNKVGYR